MIDYNLEKILHLFKENELLLKTYTFLLIIVLLFITLLKIVDIITIKSLVNMTKTKVNKNKNSLNSPHVAIINDSLETSAISFC